MALAAAAGSAFAAVDPKSLADEPSARRLRRRRPRRRSHRCHTRGFLRCGGDVLAGLGVGPASRRIQFTTGRRNWKIRLALGARPSQILQLVLRRVGTLVLIGVVSGTLASLWLTRSLAALLFGLRAHDLLTFSVAALVLALVGGFAAWWPASRAARPTRHRLAPESLT